MPVRPFILSAILLGAMTAQASALPIKLPTKSELETRVKGYPAALTDLPPAVIAAFIAQQDRFYWERVRAGKTSTLTETSVRLLAADTPTDWAQASPLEKEDAVDELTLTATPEQILTVYLNLIPLGSGHTGLTEAAKGYFDKTPKELTPAEAAWLAAVSGSPEIALKPANQARTKSQRDYILRQMEKAGALTASALEEQLGQPLPEV